MPWNDVTIVRVVQETPVDRTFHLAPAPGGALLEGLPGQYLVLRDPTEEPARDWYFSLSGMPSKDGLLRFTVRARGEAVARIYDAPQGTAWVVKAPAGAFVVTAAEGEPVVLAAAGSGITPFRTFLEQRRTDGVQDPVWLFHCARGPQELLFGAELAAWAAEEPALNYRPRITGDDVAWDGPRGRLDTDALRPALADPAKVKFYACGPGPFVEAALDAAAALGVPEDRRLREAW